MEIPRSEYPRPQFARKEWQSLNGDWEFAFDDTDSGLTDRWFDGTGFKGQIVVPFPYQSPASEINDKGIHEVVWYAKEFERKSEWKGLDLLLHFGAVDYYATVWVNGREVGHNRGGHVPFWFDIAPYLHDGANRIVVRVVDKNDAYQPRGKQSVTGVPHDIDYYCTTGIWQSVWLEPVATCRIDSARITPIFHNNGVEIRIFLHAPSTGWVLEVEISNNGEVVCSDSRHVSTAFGRLFLTLPEPVRHWSPEHPHLYDTTIRLLDHHGLVDEVKTYFGMRSVELREHKFWLNGQPRGLKMVLDQGYWAEGLLAAPSDAALRADVEWAKAFGFNGARKHQKIEDPRWLYWCDKLGLMVWSEMPNARAWSPATEDALMAEWKSAVERDLNHPSVVAWVPVNESMGFPELREGHPGQYAFLEKIVMATRYVDPERPVIDNDGWEHTDVTDICAIHDYSPTSEQLVARYAETLKGNGLPASAWIAEKPVFAKGSRDRGQPIMFTEVGGFLTVPENIPREKWDELYDYYGSVGSAEELVEKYADLITGISALPFVSGFCYTQLTDVEQESNGLLTYGRKPKIDPSRVKAINDRVLD